MKLKWKIYLLCLAIYIMSMLLTAVVVTSSSYKSLLDKEIERSLNEQESIKNSASLYLLVNIKDSESEIKLEDYSERIVDMFTSKSVYLQVYSKDGKLLSDGFQMEHEKRKSELTDIEPRSWVTRTIGNNRFLFINDKLDLGGDYIILTTVKDITHIDDQKNDMYFSFLKTSLLGLVLMSFLVAILGQYITKPIEYLITASKKIAEGNYKDRVIVSSQDEIGMLSNQFNAMAEQIESKISELQKESQNKQEFIDNLTHELRTPLTSIIGYSELLMGIKYDEASFNKGLKFIHSEGRRILNMVNTLMDLILARVGSLNIIETNAEDLLADAHESVALKAKEKSVFISLQGQNFNLFVDETLFKMALINLMDNAIKASKENSSIEITYNRSDTQGSITITDNGCGIAENHLQKIMEPFYRVDKSRARQAGGLGLGLALVKTIISTHGGSLNITSKVGEGTSITISIPIKEVK